MNSDILLVINAVIVTGAFVILFSMYRSRLKRKLRERAFRVNARIVSLELTVRELVEKAKKDIQSEL